MPLRRAPSLVLRLTVLFGVAAALVFPLFGLVIDRSVQSHFDTEDAAELHATADAARGVLHARYAGEEAGVTQRRFDDILVGHHDASLQVLRRGGSTLYASPGPDLSALARNNSQYAPGAVFRWEDSGDNYRVLIRQVGDPGFMAGAPYTVIVAVGIDYQLRFLAGFRRTLWLMSGGGIATMILLGWVAVRAGHVPLRRVVARIRETSANRLGTQLPVESLPVELTALAVSFNEMLARIEEGFVRLSNFSADIAHELRTPVANLMTQTEVALSTARSAEEYRKILYSNLEEYERLAQMIRDMLFLAQADHGVRRLNVVELRLEDEVRAVLDYYEAWAEEKGVALVVEGAARVAGDRLMVRRALSNLLSNAVRHTPEGHAVRVYLDSPGNNEVRIVVENPGATIPAQHLSRLFDRFHRVEPSRRRSGDGAGLGLAIVKSIVEAHGGRIEVLSESNLVRFTIRLPKRRLSE